MKRIILLVVLIVMSCCKPCSSPVHTSTKFIRDSAGRVVIYHGANVSNYAKHSGPQGHASITWQSQEDFKTLKALGYNVIRYTVFWEALEPTEGKFDTTYLAASVAKIKEAQACSLDVIIDMHQDLFAQRYSGDGFPDWMVKDTGKPFKLNTANWSLNYLQPAVLACFDNFWNDPSAQAKYARSLKRFVKAFDTLPGVVGYDIMNEPFPGATLPCSFEEVKLTKFYDRMLATVRESSRKLIFFEPWMVTSAGLGTCLKFKPDSLCVYAPHYYNLICESNGAYNAWNTIELKNALRDKACEARNFGVPILLGEFGISTKSPRYYEYLTDLCDQADVLGISWTYWAYDRLRDSGFGLLNDDGSNSAQARAIQRVYPQRIAGENPTWWYNGKKFSLEYDATGLNAPTVIYIPSECQNVVIRVNGSIAKKQATGSPFIYSDTAVTHSSIEVTHD